MTLSVLWGLKCTEGACGGPSLSTKKEQIDTEDDNSTLS